MSQSGYVALNSKNSFAFSVYSMTPNCLKASNKSPIESLDTTFPLTIRHIWTALNVIFFPVGANPSHSPLCVPVPVKQTHTLSPSAIMSSIVSIQSGKPLKNANSKTLFPHWRIDRSLDKGYPGGVSSIAVGLWADTGTINYIQELSYGGSIPEFPSWIILPLVLTATVFLIIVKRKLHDAKVS
jgi:hypothetical protein